MNYAKIKMGHMLCHLKMAETAVTAQAGFPWATV
jgi:hypothetical protein